MNDLELRLYAFVPYNLSPIQQGIQTGHAALEYARTYGNTELFKNFVDNYKTFIVLNGGTTRSVDMAQANNVESGTMNQIKVLLLQNYIPFACFEEPDLNYALTGICFIADERVFDKKKYPDFRDTDFIKNMLIFTQANNITDESLRKNHFPEHYSDWVESVGGEKNVFLRELLKDKRLA